jgi:Flp pilus assembly protein TadG
MNRIRSEKGAALLETAITLPIILLVSVGIFEFGRAYQTWQVLTNAAREGARVAVIQGTTDDAIKARVVAYMQNGALPDGAATMVSVTRNVALTGTTDTGTQITINYPFQFMVLNPVVRLIAPTSTTGAPITMQSNALMRNEM